MVTTDKNAFAVFIIHDVERTVCDDHAVTGAEALRNQIAVIQPFLHHDQRMRAGLLDALDGTDDEFRIDIGIAVHLLTVKLRCRTLYPFMQVLAQLVLAKRMSRRSFLGIHRGFIWKVLLQPRRRRAVQPPLRAGCRQNCVYFWHMAPPIRAGRCPSEMPRTSQAAGQTVPCSRMLSEADRSSRYCCASS